jgi:hypothetical protein
MRQYLPEQPKFPQRKSFVQKKPKSVSGKMIRPMGRIDELNEQEKQYQRSKRIGQLFTVCVAIFTIGLVLYLLWSRV